MNEEKEDFVNLSVRGTPAILSLFAMARVYQPINRNALFQEAVEYAIKTQADWPFLVKMASSEYNIGSAETGPDFVQLRLPRGQWEAILSSIKSAFKPNLKRVYTSYIIKLVLINYNKHLAELNEVGETRTEEYPSPERKEIRSPELSAPEMSSLLTSMILENSKALIEIEKIMIKYKKGDYDK